MAADCIIRFTPTHVGKTLHLTFLLENHMVHPHARGEDISNSNFGAGVVGSPPRTWGRRIHREGVVGFRWFTPTHVGKTSTSVRPRRAHGSPPRTWGRQFALGYGAVVDWFTPTHVGKTSPRLLGGELRMVHPHARGEDMLKNNQEVVLSGSPPRTWGRLYFICIKTYCIWFTPTHVGKTLNAPGLCSLLLVHPHARGEDVEASAQRHRR